MDVCSLHDKVVLSIKTPATGAVNGVGDVMSQASSGISSMVMEGVSASFPLGSLSVGSHCDVEVAVLEPQDQPAPMIDSSCHIGFDTACKASDIVEWANNASMRHHDFQPHDSSTHAVWSLPVRQGPNQEQRPLRHHT